MSADGLTLRFSATPGLEVVGTFTGEVAGLHVVAEVLAASHRVHVSDGDALVATEQVACVAGAGDPLPVRAAHETPGHRLAFDSERIDRDRAALADLAEALRAGGTGPDALVVSFPGHPDALTSVRIVPGGWETWHLYPGDHPHAVRTRTAVTAR